MTRVIRVRYEKGILKPLNSVDFKEGEELLVKVIGVERKRRVLRKYRGVLGPVPKELLDRFMLEAEEQ